MHRPPRQRTLLVDEPQSFSQLRGASRGGSRHRSRDGRCGGREGGDGQEEEVCGEGGEEEG